MAQVQSRFITEDEYRCYREKQDKELDRELGIQQSLIEKGNKKLRDELVQEVNNVNDGVSQVKDRLGYVEARLDQMDGRSYNKSRFLPWHDLARVGVYRLGTGFETPEYFPENIREFWTLQFPRSESHLLYLVRFYDIHGHVHWGEANLDLVDILDAADTSILRSSLDSRLLCPPKLSSRLESQCLKAVHPWIV